MGELQSDKYCFANEQLYTPQSMFFVYCKENGCFMPKGSSHFMMLIAMKYGVKDLHLLVDV